MISDGKLVSERANTDLVPVALLPEDGSEAMHHPGYLHLKNLEWRKGGSKLMVCIRRLPEKGRAIVNDVCSSLNVGKSNYPSRSCRNSLLNPELEL